MSNVRALSVARLVIGAAAVLKTVPLAMQGVGAAELGVWLVLAFLVALGVRARPAAALLCALAFALLLTGVYRNHLYLLASVLLLISVSDCERRYAIRPNEGGASDWPLLLMRVQLSIVYGYAGVAKLLGDWPDGAFVRHIAEIAVVPTPGMTMLAIPIAWGVILGEIALAAAPWFSRARIPAVAVAITLHAGMLLVATDVQLLLELIVFAGLMAALWIAFFATIRTAKVPRAPDDRHGQDPSPASLTSSSTAKSVETVATPQLPSTCSMPLSAA